MKANHILAKNKDLFRELVKTDSIITEHPVVSMMISFDSKRAISVQKEEDSISYVAQHDILTGERLFYEKFGGEEDSYVKLQEVVQSPSGKNFAVVYQDNGRFRLRTFG